MSCTFCYRMCRNPMSAMHSEDECPYKQNHAQFEEHNPPAYAFPMGIPLATGISYTRNRVVSVPPENYLGIPMANPIPMAKTVQFSAVKAVPVPMVKAIQVSAAKAVPVPMAKTVQFSAAKAVPVPMVKVVQVPAAKVGKHSTDTDKYDLGTRYNGANVRNDTQMVHCPICGKSKLHVFDNGTGTYRCNTCRGKR